MKWYKKLLCGFNLLGDFADWANRGTQTRYELTEADKYMGEIEIRCWCCTFWRGVFIGFFIAMLLLFIASLR